MPGLAAIHIDSALTNLSILYRNELFVAERVAPILPVQKRSDRYFIYDRAMMLGNTTIDVNGKSNAEREPNAEAAEINYTIGTDGYYAREFALRQFVSDAETAYADSPLTPDADAALFLTNRLNNDIEIGIAALVGNTVKYPTAGKKTLVTGVGTVAGDSSWKAYAQANSSPLINLIAGKLYVIQNMFREANRVLITVDGARYLAQHPLFRDQFKYVSKMSLTNSGLEPNILGLEVIEGANQKATSTDGQVLATGNTWVDSGGKNMALVYYCSDDTGPRSLHSFRQFEAPDDTSGARGVTIRRYRDEKRKGQIIEASFLRDFKAIAVDSFGNYLGGYLLSDITS